MPKLPVISGKDFVKVLEKLGFRVERQTGSHIVLRRASDAMSVSVPNHGELSKGVLNTLMKSIDLGREELLKLLR